MNEDQVEISSITDRKGAPASRVCLRSDTRYTLNLPAVRSLNEISAVAKEWLEYLSFIRANKTTLIESLQRRVKQGFPDLSWPKQARVDGWYELVVGAPLVICDQNTAERVWQHLTDKGWISDQSGRYHWPEANGALSIGKYIEWFRSDPTLRVLPVRFGIEVKGGPVADVVALCKDWPIAALINAYPADSSAADQLRRELKGHRLSVSMYETANWISPAVTGPSGVVEKAIAMFNEGVAPVLLDDPALPWGLTAAVARGVYADGLVAGAPVTSGLINPYTTNVDL